VDNQGRKNTVVTEEVDEGNGRRQKNTYQLTDGGASASGAAASKTSTKKQIRNK
jgi:DNA-binding PadR family transcriptional regulator